MRSTEIQAIDLVKCSNKERTKKISCRSAKHDTKAGSGNPGNRDLEGSRKAWLFFDPLQFPPGLFWFQLFFFNPPGKLVDLCHPAQIGMIDRNLQHLGKLWLLLVPATDKDSVAENEGVDRMKTIRMADVHDGILYTEDFCAIFQLDLPGFYSQK